MIGPPRVELEPEASKTFMLPLHHGPVFFNKGQEGIEPPHCGLANHRLTNLAIVPRNAPRWN